MDILRGLPKILQRIGLAAVCAVSLACPATVALAELPAALSEEDATIYRAAFLAGTNASDAAQSARQHADDQTLVTVLQWQALIANGTFQDIAAFLSDHPEWPQRTDLRLNAERTIPDDASLEEVAAFFAGNPPLTVLAAARYDETLRALGRNDAAEEFMRRAWRRLPLNSDQLAVFVAYLTFLGPEDHADRLAALLDAGRESEARDMLAYLDDGYAALLDARLALAADAADAEVKVAAVPAALANDPGLLFDLLRWRRHAGQITRAGEMLVALPDAATGSRWWTERRDVARSLISLGNMQLAYDVVADHRQTDGLPRYQAELLAGWIALSLLDDAETALPHFETLWQEAITPIGRSTAAYWLARTQRDLGRDDDADRWFAEAAARPSTYYGQLAAQEGQDAPPLADPEVEPADVEAFLDNPTARIVRQLDQIGAYDLRDRLFPVLLAETRTPGGFVLAARMAETLGMPEAMLDAGEAAAAAGYELGVSAWPLASLPEEVADPALTLSIIHQESRFDPQAVSSANAMGMMQLLPSTAESVAASLGLDFDEGRLVRDPDYNILIGSAHMATLMQDYGGSLILAAAAYNAGPTLVADWIDQFGDPRTGTDSANWVERIPVHETRNYVQRIAEGYEVYRTLLAASEPAGGGAGQVPEN